MMAPIEPERPDDRSPSGGTRGTTDTTSAGRILVAEDNEATKWALRRLFESTGYSVVTVSDGSEMLYELEPVILEEPQAAPPDLILTDVRMPGIDVFRVVEQLRALGLETPVLVVTGYANDRVRHRVHKLGRALFFEKPVDVETLEETVAELTDG